MTVETAPRRTRQRMRADSIRAAKSRPTVLTLVTETPKHVSENFTRAWHSKRFLVQEFHEASNERLEVFRLSICRCTFNQAGHWDTNITWDELMECKREVGYGDWYGIEVFPKDRDVVNVANMRHLWLLSVPLPIGWKNTRGIS